MARLLVVAHVVSPATRAMHEAVLEGTRMEGIVGVEVVARPALTAAPVEVLDADAVVLGTPANIGYMSGAMKVFFDAVYYPLLDAKPGLPYGLWLHGNEGTEGALRAITAITGALGWRAQCAPVVVTGAVGTTDRDACRELGAVVAAAISD